MPRTRGALRETVVAVEVAVAEEELVAVAVAEEAVVAVVAVAVAEEAVVVVAVAEAQRRVTERSSKLSTTCGASGSIEPSLS